MRPYAVRRWGNGEKRGRRFWTAVGSMVYKRDNEADGFVWGSTVKRKIGFSRIIFSEMVERQKSRKAKIWPPIQRYSRIEIQMETRKASGKKA